MCRMQYKRSKINKIPLYFCILAMNSWNIKNEPFTITLKTSDTYRVKLTKHM